MDWETRQTFELDMINAICLEDNTFIMWTSHFVLYIDLMLLTNKIL